MDQKAVLLATLEAVFDTRSPNDPPLPAETINKLGRQLGFSDETTFHLIGQLSAEGKVALEWGGDISSVRRDVSPLSVYLGANATYLGPGAQVHGSAVGANAQVQAPHESQNLDANMVKIVAALTASIDKLASQLTGTTGEQRQTGEQLIEIAKGLQEKLLENDKSDKSALSKKLGEADQALGVIAKAGKLSAAAAPYLPQMWSVVHTAVRSLSAHLGIIY
jgi:hypothetical protein